MSFITYNLRYYLDRINEFESTVATKESVYEAKQLLKVIDDLIDENYSVLSDQIEAQYNGVTRLKNYIYSNGEEAFESNYQLISKEIIYNKTDIELESEIDKIIVESKYDNTSIKSPIIDDLKGFCDWIGYSDKCSYIFLLRDTLLPYIYYKEKKRSNIYPWLVGRKTIEYITNKKDVDDEIRNVIIQALENDKCSNFTEFKNYVLPRIKNLITTKYPILEETILKLLSTIKKEKIILVESGCYGTIPMLLMSLDNRIDVRMYTSVPNLFNAYSERIYTKKYENNRLFETINCQNLMYKFSKLENNYFFVNKADSELVSNISKQEIYTMIKDINN